MMRSMYSAVSSLKSHQLKMDVIGNNIANVNTVGFKGSRVTFQEVFSQTLRGAGRPQENGRGGTNPQQVGLGMSVNSMDTFHMRGSVESTGYNTDLMINGDGFFIVSDTASGLNKNYTRAGNFTLDTDGNLLTPDGYYVLGYKANEDGTIEETLTGLQISKSVTAPPKATDIARFEGNINSKMETYNGDIDGIEDLNTIIDNDKNEDIKSTYSTVMKVYDSLGNDHNVTITFVYREIDVDGNRTFNAYISEIDGHEPEDDSNFNVGSVTFDTTGKLVKINDGANGDLTNQDEPTPFSRVPVEIGGSFLNGANNLNIGLDFSQLKSYSSPSDAAALDINGYPSGKLDDFTISTTGEIEGVFSNGQTRLLGQLRLANFKNPAGLLKTGSNMYRETANSGEAMFGYPASGGFASLQPGALEMSNVDLSREFTDMITTQRGFQANSRVITTSDEMLQELVNMKR